MTDVNIWSRAFSDEEAVAWNRFEMEGGGDLVDWSTAQWSAVGLEKVQVDRAEVCRRREGRWLLVSDVRRDFDATVQFCSILGGEMVVTDDKETALEARKAFKSANETCGENFFSGFTDSEEEGKFVNINTGEEMTWDNWEHGQPNDIGSEDCSVQVATVTDYDQPCTFTFCPICVVKESPKFQLRGACEDSHVDIHYLLQLGGGPVARKELLGYTQTKMTRSAEDKRWNIVNLVDERILAFTNDTEDFPISSHRWFFTDERCRDPSEQWRLMSLQQASVQPGQFCCDDGLCVPSEMRCDGDRQCGDASDEKGCQMVQLPADRYNSERPPSQMTRKGRKMEFSQIEVETSVKIVDIIKVNEASSVISLIFVIYHQWIDPRLTFNFLQRNPTQNMVGKDSGMIWTPQLSFLVVLDSIQIDQRVVVLRLGKAKMSAGLDSLEVNESYAGSENPIRMRTTYQSDIVCTFAAISLFPFDKEECSLQFYIPGAANNLTSLIAGNITNHGPTSVSQYDVTAWSLAEGRMAGNQGLRMTVHLERNLISILLVTYLPTVLINLVNQATNYIQREDNFETVITVNITCMMVLASVYLSVSSSLPPTAVIKAIEIWLLFNLTFPVMVILANIMIQVTTATSPTSLCLFLERPDQGSQEDK